MSGNGNQGPPLAPSQRGSGPYPRASTPHRPECYHPAGTGAAYMPNTAGGAQSSSQPTLRVQPNPQPSAPPAPQQDLSKTAMSGHSYVSPQNQNPPTRPQYQNFQYRPAQHGTRPNTHQRAQQQFMPNASATANAPVMYHTPTLVFQPAHMVAPTYQQPRSTTQGYYQYVPPPYLSYSTPASHTPPYYYHSNSQQMPAQNIPANPPGGRANTTTLMGPQGTQVTPTAPTASLTHSQPPGHMHQPMPRNFMPGIIPAPVKRSRRVPIIDPVTQQEVLSDLYSDNNQHVSGESSERQTPQPAESTPSIAEEFSRMVNEVANQPTSCESAIKPSFVAKTEMPISSTSNTITPQNNAICSINNNIVKSDLNSNENKKIGSDVAIEPNETPVVSAISDSPVIVPKMPINIKQIQKSSEQNILTVVVDSNNKNIPLKQPKQNRSKPLVPQGDDVEKISESVSHESGVGPSETAAPVLASVAAPVAVAEVVPVAMPAPAPAAAPAPAPAPAAAPAPAPASAPAPVAVVAPLAPQPQRIREPRERPRSEEKDKVKEAEIPQNESVPVAMQNGPTTEISSVENLQEIDPSTSQNIQPLTSESLTKQTISTPEIEIVKTETEVNHISVIAESISPTATELLSASIEKIAKDQSIQGETEAQRTEVSSAIQAQAKLTQSIASCIRTSQPESKMKDINLNIKTDPDTANGNTEESTTTESIKEDINKNEKIVKINKNNKKSTKMANSDINLTEESYENGKEETDKISNEEHETSEPKEEEMDTEVSGETVTAAEAPALVPKYKYSDDQWSPFNKAGKKCYDISLLKQIKEDPLSKNKPTNAAFLEACNVIRALPLQDVPITFSNLNRPANDSLFPNFFPKTSGVGPRNSAPRDAKRDSRNMVPSGKSSVQLSGPQGGGGGGHKPVRHVSLSLREEVKLNQSKDAWKPTRFKKENLEEEELQTLEIYRKFRGILNKLTPQKFDTLMNKVDALEINNQKRLEGVIGLVFEKAIDEPNFSEAYAAMCSKLAILKVPADDAPDQDVNFRGLIINKCQKQFEYEKSEEKILKLEKELSECTDAGKKKELQGQITEESRKIRMRSVGNIRFIGELYKLNMLTSKIIMYCMTHLIDKLEEEKLECLCKLLTTVGEQVESGSAKDQLDNVFKKMQEIVDRKSNKISSRVRFMLQDVIDLRRRRWVAKNVVDLQPKMMDQIQKEAEQQQRNIELMNASSMGGFRRDDGGRGKRGGDNRRQGSNTFMDTNNWKTPRSSYSVDTSKLKAGTQPQKNLNHIKLAPQTVGWNHGSSTKNMAQTTASSNSIIGITKNMYSMLEVSNDPTSNRSNKDVSSNYSKGASIERSTFNSRGDFSSGSGSRSGSIGLGRSNSSSRSSPPTPPSVAEPTSTAAPTPQAPLPEALKKTVKSVIEESKHNDAELVVEINHILVSPSHQAGFITEILNVALEKPPKEILQIANSLVHIISTNTISADNLVLGMKEIFECAPDLYIDIPMLYEYFGWFIAPHIEKEHITFTQILKISETIIASNHGHFLLKAIVKNLKESMGPTFVKNKWQKCGLQLKDWMEEDQVPKWLEDNKFEFLEGGPTFIEDTTKILTPQQTQSKLLQLMNTDETCESIKTWVEENIGQACNEDSFMRSLIQAICEHALFNSEARDVPQFNQDKMYKYCGLINEFGKSRQAREASCLFGIQQLIHRLEHPQGLTLKIFQYLNEQYIISAEGFISWEESIDEPEGKAVMLKALTSFFTDIREADNESCSEA